MKKLSLCKWFVLLLMPFLLTGCSPIEWISESVSSLFVWTFAFIGIWYVFWPFIAIGFILLSWIAEDFYDSPFFVIFGFGVYLAIIQFSQKVDIIIFIKESTGIFCVYLIVYIIIGIIYSAFRTYRQGREVNKRYLEKKEEFFKNSTNTEEEWLQYNQRSINTKSMKSRIITWIAYWPCSAFWYFFHDGIKGLIERIYQLLSTMYDRIYRNSIPDIVSDYEKMKKIEEDARNKKSKRRNYEEE